MFIAATTHSSVSGDIVWDTDGYAIFGDQAWKDITVVTTFTYNGGDIGILPRYFNEQAYMAFVVGNHSSQEPSSAAVAVTTATASFSVQLLDRTAFLGKKDLTSAFVIGTTYQLKVEIRKTNFRAYLDGAMIFNAEYNGLPTGQVGIYATTGNSCAILEVKGNTPGGWENNVQSVNGATVDIHKLSNNDTYAYMDNPNGTSELWIRQQVAVTSGSYTLSYSYLGALTSKIVEVNGAALATHSYADTNVVDWTYASHTVTIPSDCTQVYVYISLPSSGAVQVNAIQFEKNPFATDYIENTSLTSTASRGASQITYPSAGNIDVNTGSISLWIKPSVTYDNALGLSPALFEYGNSDGYIRIHHASQALAFTYGAQTVVSTAATALQANIWYHIVANWSSTDLSIYVDGVGTAASGMYTFAGSSTLMSVGFGTGKDTFNGVFDELIIFSKPVNADDITTLYQATEAIRKTDAMLLHSTFDYEIANFESSMMEISPAPLFGSPVLATKADGTDMSKVSFYDPYLGNFRPYNIEPVVYDGQSDYLVVGSKDIEAEKFKVQVKDYHGVLVGDPYQVKGDRIYLELTLDQKKALWGSTLYVMYQPKNAYTVDFNIGVPDSFQVNLGKHDGQSVSVTYEGNKSYVDKLADMVELNPLLSPHHDGFLYITQTGKDISSFRAKATPDDLPADGFSECMVVIEPVDPLGNFISNAALTVTATRGTIIPNTDPGSVSLRQTAGRYIYRYRAPLIRYSDMMRPDLAESINVLDTSTGLGVQIPITLALSDIYPEEGRVKAEQISWEAIAAYLLDKILANFNKAASSLPAGLGALLDLDGDGTIGFKEILWINKYKFSQTLYNQYISLVQWYTQNP